MNECLTHARLTLISLAGELPRVFVPESMAGTLPAGYAAALADHVAGHRPEIGQGVAHMAAEVLGVPACMDVEVSGGWITNIRVFPSPTEAAVA